MRFSHHVTSYFSIFFQPVSLVSLSQYFGDFLIVWISLPQIFLPTFRTITSPTGFPAIQTIISLLQEFTSLPLAIFPLFGHLICLPHASLPTFMPIASFTGFPALQSILRLLPTFTFPPLANCFNYLAHFFSLFIQTVFFSQFFGHFLNPVDQLSHMFPSTSLPALSLTGFPAIYLSNFSSSSLIHVPFPENFSHCWAYFFSHLVSLPEISLPKSSSHLANSCCVIGPTSKSVA